MRGIGDFIREHPFTVAGIAVVAVATAAAGFFLAPALLAIGFTAEVAATAAIAFNGARLAITLVGAAGGAGGGGLVAAGFNAVTSRIRNLRRHPNFVHLGENSQSQDNGSNATLPATQNNLSAGSSQQTEDTGAENAAEAFSSTSPHSEPGDPFASLSISDSPLSPIMSPRSLSECESTDSENELLTEDDRVMLVSKSRSSTRGGRICRKSMRTRSRPRLELLAFGKNGTTQV